MGLRVGDRSITRGGECVCAVCACVCVGGVNNGRISDNSLTNNICMFPSFLFRNDRPFFNPLVFKGIQHIQYQ